MEYLPLGCFGKAPCDREYLEHNVSFGTTRKLRSWIREGFKLARLAEDGNGRNDYREAGVRGFLIGKPDADEWIVGVLGPSTDSEPRDNVLAVFTHLSRRTYSKGYFVLPIAVASVWRALDDTRQHLLELQTVEDFKEYMRANRVPAPGLPPQSNADYKSRQRDDVQRVFERQDGARLDLLESNFRDVVERIRDKATTSLAVEFPVSRDTDDAAFDAAFWLHLVNAQFIWRKRWPAIFMDLPSREQDRSVVLAYGALDPVLYGPIMSGNRLAGQLFLRPAAGVPGGGTEGAGPGAPGVTPLSFGQLLGRKFD